MKVTARAHSNIALIKYWGKRNTALNLPDVGSISMTLEKLYTQTTVEFSEKFSCDRLILNGKEAGQKDTARIGLFLDIIRKWRESGMYARVESANNFPTAAGLASSASGFAALTKAATAAAGLSLSNRELSILARQGSGSAARSIYGGFVEMYKGQQADGSDAYAEQLFPPEYWDIRLLIAVTSEKKKKTASTDGMTLSKNTSPYYRDWVASHPPDLQEMRSILKTKDFQKLGELSEFSCLKMHALALASNPGMLYWNAATVAGMHAVREMRDEGIPVYFTIDAGPQLKAICLPRDIHKVEEALTTIPGVSRIIQTGIGDDARIIREEP